MSGNREKLIDMLLDGAIDAQTLAINLLGYLSQEECADFAHQNDIELFPEDEDEQSFEFEDEEEVLKAFEELWAEHILNAPHEANDKPAKLIAFSCFVDDLQRDGRISDDLASEVALS